MKKLSGKIFGDTAMLFDRREEYSRNRLFVLCFSVFANISAVLQGGNFFTGLQLRMGAKDVDIGNVTIVTQACSMLAIFCPLVVEGLLKRKKMLLITRSIYVIVLPCCITVIPFLNIGSHAQLTLLLAVVAAANLLSSLTSSGIAVWHLQSLPESTRLPFFTNLNMIVGTINMLMLNLAGVFIDYFKAHGNELLGIVLLRIVACLVSALDIFCASRIREYAYAKPEKKINLVEIFKNPLSNMRYRAVMGIAVLWSLTVSIPGPFYQVYLLKVLHINYSFLCAVNLMNIPAILFCMPVWRRVIVRFGDIRLFAPLAFILSFHYLALSFVTASNYFWLYPLACMYYFVIISGITQICSLLPYKFIAEANQSNYISFYGTITTLSALLGTLIGQMYIASSGGVNFKLFAENLCNKQLVVILTGASVFCAAIAMFFISRWLERGDPPKLTASAQ